MYSFSKPRVPGTRSGCRQPDLAGQDRTPAQAPGRATAGRSTPNFTSFSYPAQNWKKPRQVVTKVEWHAGELYPRVGFIVTNLVLPAERVVAFYNQRGTAEQRIKEGNKTNQRCFLGGR